MTYKSKVDAWLVAATVGVVAAAVVPCLFVDFSWAALAIMLLTLALILLALFGIRYEVAGGKLRVSCCRLVMDTIDISKITQIRPTRTLISAPAASIDRLEIRAGRRSVVVSPRCKEAFINNLLEINPGIEVKG